MRVFIAGASGVIGRRLIPLLVQQGHAVTGMTRSESKAAGYSGRPATESVDRPKRSYGDKPKGDFGDKSKRPYSGRPATDGADRPKRSYGDKPTFVLTSRQLPRTRDTVEFHSGDLTQFVNHRLRPSFKNIWFVGGGVLSAECVRLGLADELRYSVLPVLIGHGIQFFDKLDTDVALHLLEVKAYDSGVVGLRYEIRK